MANSVDRMIKVIPNAKTANLYIRNFTCGGRIRQFVDS